MQNGNFTHRMRGRTGKRKAMKRGKNYSNAMDLGHRRLKKYESTFIVHSYKPMHGLPGWQSVKSIQRGFLALAHRDGRLDRMMRGRQEALLSVYGWGALSFIRVSISS